MDIAGCIDAVVATGACGCGYDVIPSLSPRGREGGPSGTVAWCQCEGGNGCDVACDSLGVDGHSGVPVGLD